MHWCTRQSIALLIVLAVWSTIAPDGPSDAQERRIRILGFAQGHIERVETITNGNKESFDLVEPSLGAEASGYFLSRRFMFYEAGISLIRSDLNGTEFDLKSRDVNYNGHVTLFPGRRVSFEVFGRRLTDKLEDNLFLFNRIKLQDIGARARVLQRGRLPSLVSTYRQREQETTTSTSRFDQNSKEFDIHLDRRTADLHYHLSFRTSEFESKDFGYKSNTDFITASVLKRLTTHLTGELSGEYIRTETTVGRPSLSRTSFVTTSGRKREQKELRMRLGLHYKSERLRGEGDYDYRRIEDELLTITEQTASIKTTYQPSLRTKFEGSLSVARSDSDFASSSSLNLGLGMTRQVRPNLVFYVESESRLSRHDNPTVIPGVTTRLNTTPEFTVNDLRAGVGYNRRFGNFSTMSNLLLGVGRASVNPGESGGRSKVEASFSIRGRVPAGVDLSVNLIYEDRNDSSTFSPSVNRAQAQIVAIRRLGPRLQLRGSLYALRLMQEADQLFTLPGTVAQSEGLDLTQRTAELGASFFLRRNLFGRALVGYTKSTSAVTNQEDAVSDIKYFDASLHALPARGLDILARFRVQRGTQPVEVQSDQDFAELNVSYRLRAWQVLLGYSTNQIILGSTDLEQNRIFLTVRRNFALGLL